MYEVAIFLFFLEPLLCRVKMSKQQPHKWRGRLRCDQNFILVVVIKFCTTALLQKPDHVIKKIQASKFCMTFCIGAQEHRRLSHCHGQRPGLQLRFLGCCKCTRKSAKDRDKNILVRCLATSCYEPEANLQMLNPVLLCKALLYSK